MNFRPCLLLIVGGCLQWPIRSEVSGASESGRGFRKWMGLQKVGGASRLSPFHISFQVVVYSGQLDLICDTIGTELWVQKLKWAGLQKYNSAPRKTIRSPTTNHPVAFVKQFENFSFYWILDAGHMVPSDAGEASMLMVKMVTS